MKIRIIIAIMILSVLMLSSCGEAQKEILSDIGEIAKNQLSKENENIKDMFYMRTMANKNCTLYLVEYGSYDIQSSSWIGTVIIDANDKSVISVESDSTFFSGVMPELYVGARTSEKELENEFGIFYLRDYNKDVSFTTEDNVWRIEEKLDIDIRNYVSIIEQRRVVEYGEEHIKMKLLMQEEKVEKIQEQLDIFFEQRRYVEETSLFPNFQNVCSWWDLDIKDVQCYYDRMMSGKRAKTIEIYVFIAKVEDTYYLYIAY